MADIFTAPERDTSKKNLSLFVAGGITDCPMWQDEYIEYLRDINGLSIYNPRRKGFNVRDPSMTDEQIQWEHEYLSKADVVSFWFPCETLCPITLYELGCMTSSGRKIFIGVHPDYKRRVDVETQTSLKRPEIEIVYSLHALANQVVEYKQNLQQ